MMVKKVQKKLSLPVLLLWVWLLTPVASFGLDLAAFETQWTPPGGGAPITMWGFAADPGSCAVPPVSWDIGPTQVGIEGGSLTVQLRNCLSEPVSLVIPGQEAILAPQTFVDGQGRTRVRAFTAEAAAGGGVATYTWNNLKAGTYMYQSGSHPAKQVQMGLFGAVQVGSYAGADSELMVFYSEIDPALHIDPATTSPTPLGYKPKYYLVNGQAYAPGDPVPALLAGEENSTVLIRFVNAGYMAHLPVLQGPYMQVIAEDGNPYPYAREQYSLRLEAGKTKDVLWTPTQVGNHALYDRSLSLTTNGAVGGGLLVHLNVAAAGSLPVADAGPDQSGVALGLAVNLDGSGSTPPTVTYQWSFALKPGGSTAVLSDPSLVNPSFIPDVYGTYEIQLVVNDSGTNSAPDTVLVVTNQIPIADAGVDQAVPVGTLVALDGSGSGDPDTDPITYLWSITQMPAGSTAALSDPTSSAPDFTADEVGDYVVELVVNDGTQDSVPDSVTITAEPPVNSPPVAENDSVTTVRNSSAIDIDVLANDYDLDGTLVPDSIVITTGRTSSRGGRVAVRNGLVRYRPPKNFVGTDLFRYTVMDDSGAVSNEATVRINVVLP